MVAVRRLAVCAFIGALAAAFAGAANAARPNAALFPETITTPHFLIHFTGELVTPANPNRITFQTAGTLGSLAEQAYETIVTGWGYPAPLNDGDGRIDVWVQDLSLSKVLGLATTDAAGNTATGWISIDVTAATSRPVIAHEFVHLIQFGQWITADSWLREVTAEWASFAASSYVPFGGSLAATIASPDMSLDCNSDACGNDKYETGGSSRWTFFEYMSDRFGLGFVKDVFARGAALADPAQTGKSLLSSTLVTKGTTLTDVYNDYSVVHLASSYDVAGLQMLSPAAYSTASTGSSSGPLAVQLVPVNHLATRYLKLTRGATGAACFPATLSLTVSLPAGIGSKPAFFSKSLGSAAIPLSVNGNTGTLSVPWDTCFGGSDGYLSLPNPSVASDAQLFTVSGTLTVDTTKVVSPAGPPAPVYTGTTVASPVTDLAPSIFVYGAQLIRVSAASRTVRLIVFSSGSGKLQGSLGGAPLGIVALRAGNNDVRFRLPTAAVKALRKTSATAASQLTLTSLSTGGAKGTTVTRTLAVVPPKPGRG